MNLDHISLEKDVFRKGCALLLTMALGHMPLYSQQAAANSGAVAQPQLRIIVLEGQDAVNGIESGQAITPVVEIRDSNDLPVEDAEVTFRLPVSGPGGQFRDGSSVFTARTNLQGQTQAPYVMNSETGEFTIAVAAQIGELDAETSIRQTHIAGSAADYLRKRKKRWYKGWKLWAVLGGVAAGAIVAVVASGGGDGGVVITPGPPVVGGPQ